MQRTCDVLELYALLRDTNAASAQLLKHSTLGPIARDPSLQTAFAAHSSGGGMPPAEVLQEGAQKVVLAMVQKVSRSSCCASI